LMRHCVASYTYQIYDSQYAVYKVLEPERLTLGLSLRHGGVGLDQLKGVANRAPSPEAQAAVEQWLHEQLKVARSWGKGSVWRALGIIGADLARGVYRPQARRNHRDRWWRPPSLSLD
ncbi:hypothetical protein U5801_25465, partial [Lamprobacter modestohalophilus]|uniref:hypothetical protein n=1 Tax=Lamprobacter modestohalophilus TaxID=1064514 RepID=UPI002ADEE3F2